MTDSNPSYNIEAYRKQIPLLKTHIPMNNCSQAPQTDATRAAAERYLDSWNTVGMDWDSWMSEVALAKAEFAKLINAKPHDIAVFGSVSDATSAVASALTFDDGRHDVVVSEAEFPGVAHVWQAQIPLGARIKWAELRDGMVEPSLYDSLVTKTTALVSACHGYYMNGFIHDVEGITYLARKAGALSFLDAYQTLGAVPVDVEKLEVDILVSGNLKYLMGVPGIAFLYVRPYAQPVMIPSTTGWFGRKNPFDFNAKRLDWSPTASRFDTGTPPVINAFIARAGMQLINEIGVKKIRAWHEVLGQRLMDGGRERGLKLHGTDVMKHKTVSTAFIVKNAHAVEGAMIKRGVIPSARGEVIRLAPHYYSTLADVDRALDILASVQHVT